MPLTYAARSKICWLFLYYLQRILAEYERECAGVDFGGSGGDICSIMGDTACVNGRCVVQQEVNDYFCECNFGYEVSEDNKQCVGKRRFFKVF